MRPPIFDSIDRTLITPKGHQESTFSFFNRVDGAYWFDVRTVMQSWADRFPDEHYVDLRSMLRSGDDHQFNSAYLELYLHEFLWRAGFEITIHPSTPSGRRPDFFAARGDGAFYLEAIAPAPSPAAKAKSARLGQLYEVIDKIDEPDWWLWLERIDEGAGPPSATMLRSGVRAWLRTLRPEDFPDMRTRPRFSWKHNGWEVELTALPKPPASRGTVTGRTIGVYPATGGFVDDSSPIRQALARKDRRYGDLGEALVIAIGVYNFDRDRSGTANALWGNEAIQVSTSDLNDQGRLIRLADGYFGVDGAWRHTNVSGVLVVNQLQPTHFLSADLSLWLHPAPSHPLPVEIGWPIDEIAAASERLAVQEASTTPREFFEMPEEWPTGEAFPK
jgi:hypothetical protein